MQIKDIAPTFTHGRGPKAVTTANELEEAKNTGQNQANVSSGITADIKIDSSHLPEPARSAPAHLARELLEIQEVAANAEAPKNFGHLVAQIAKGERTFEPEESVIQQADLVSSTASDEVER
jgi:hypothetical protein